MQRGRRRVDYAKRRRTNKKILGFFACVIVLLIFIANSQGNEKQSRTSTFRSQPAETSTAPLSPTELANSLVKKYFQDSIDNSVTYRDENGGSLHIIAIGKDNLTSSFIRSGMWSSIANSLEGLRDTRISEVSFSVHFPMTDEYGNTSNKLVMNCYFSQEARDKINWDGFNFSNIPAIAQSYWEAPVFG